MDNDILDAFLSDIDTVNNYCKEQKDSCRKCYI